MNPTLDQPTPASWYWRPRPTTTRITALAACGPDLSLNPMQIAAVEFNDSSGNVRVYMVGHPSPWVVSGDERNEFVTACEGEPGPE